MFTIETLENICSGLKDLQKQDEATQKSVLTALVDAWQTHWLAWGTFHYVISQERSRLQSGVEVSSILATLTSELGSLSRLSTPLQFSVDSIFSGIQSSLTLSEPSENPDTQKSDPPSEPIG